MWNILAFVGGIGAVGFTANKLGWEGLKTLNGDNVLFGMALGLFIIASVNLYLTKGKRTVAFGKK